MDLNNYSLVSKNYEKSLDLEYKKNKGIFYTDVELANRIIDFLDIPKDCVILDPCCGTGNFLVAARNRGYQKTYGADIDKKAISLSKKNTNVTNLKVIDTLANKANYVLNKLKLKEQVDVIVGNPPYAPIVKDIIIDTSDYLFLREVKDSGSNLFIAALYRAFDLVKESGIISYVIPKNFLHVSSYKILRKMILSEKQIISIVDIGKKFKNVRGEQIILTLRNKFLKNNNIHIYGYENNKIIKKLEVPQNFYKDEILLFGNEEDFSIFKKLEGAYQKFSDICTGYVGRGRSKSDTAIIGKDIRKFSFKNIEVPKKGNRVFIQNIYSAESGIIASFAGELEAAETVTIFTDGDEKMCRYILGFLHSRLCNYYLLKFCFNNSKLTMHTDAKYLKKLPLVKDSKTFLKVISIVKSLEKIDYMSEEWFEMLESLNNLIYKIYGIDENEKNYIDFQMKSIQSKRWNSD
ncbi:MULTISPECIES: HsdM family class I SAM-dependent methyltransferase [Fusobacterium]|uniref:site-specific DNA-methyltransferase (adenine-specific) n=1 Tax=Fusobacterium canifelinum TaxID=285729 RepID=A0ABX7CEL9_9FUSO|nr:N-6 DNA methylase [Fusobacterium canifelinum]QQS87849.1 N-6 DNA methylase [Fusobacterium canifelinum]